VGFLAVAAPATAVEPDRVDARGGAVDSGAPALAPGARFVGIATASTGGYWLVTADGQVSAHGGAPDLGSLTMALRSPIVGITATPAGDGYWLVAGDGGVFALGRAPFLGSLGDIALRRPVVAIAATSSGRGYLLAAADGGVFTFGDAVFAGSVGDRQLAEPVVGLATGPGGGYWLTASDGGVFSFGGAPFLGSVAELLLAAPVVGIAATPTGGGYRLAAADGGVFTFGDAGFAGAGSASDEPVVGVAATPGGGYLLVRSPSGPPLPAGSGSGRRIVYSNPLQRVWLVGADGQVERTYLVSGRQGRPVAGTYRVFSKSTATHALHGGITMRLMVRFAHGDAAAIGFHDIPLDGNGRPMQTENDLGGYRSAGCVRQSHADAAFLWDWASVGTTVVVTY
jgi:hypothetical protein